MPYTPDQWEGMAIQAYLNGLQERSGDLSSSAAHATSFGVKPLGRLQPTIGMYNPAVMNGTMSPDMGASALSWVTSPIDTFSQEYITPAIEQAGKYSAQYEAAKQAEYERQRTKDFAMYAALAVGAGVAAVVAMKKFKGR